MLRSLHSIPGLIAALLVMLLAISGATLALNPALERLHTPNRLRRESRSGNWPDALPAI